MAQDITLLGASYEDVPAVELPKTGGGVASFTDVTDTTAAASDVATGKYFYTAAGVKTEGTASGGGGAVSVVDTLDAAGGTIRTITAVDLSQNNGKVVQSGALVSQTSATYTANDTYDTTTINSVTVNVSGSYSAFIMGQVTEIEDATITEVREYGFRSYTALTRLIIPNCTKIGQQSFYGATGLSVLALPSIVYNGVSPSSIASSGIQTFDLGVSFNTIGSGNFSNATQLATLIFRKSDGLVNMANATQLNGTKFASGSTGGTIYIPKSLYDHLGDGTSSDYKAATNWSTYDGYGTITWAKIEGSYYETHYADGTLIPTS